MSEQEVFDRLRYQVERDEKGTVRYYNHLGQLDRDSGPAVIYANGEQQWYQNGQRHRTDGPAVILPNGEQQWYQNGRLHRTARPAIILPDGEQQWVIDGCPYTPHR